MNAKDIYRTVRNAVLSVPIALTLAVAPVYAGDVGKANHQENKQKTETVESKNIGKVARRFIREYNGQKVFDIDAYGKYILEKNPIGEPIDDYRIPPEFGELRKEGYNEEKGEKYKLFVIKKIPKDDLDSGGYYELVKNGRPLMLRIDFSSATYTLNALSLFDYDLDGFIDEVFNDY